MATATAMATAMATPRIFEHRLASRSCEEPSEPGPAEPALGHFLEVEDSSDQDCFLIRAMMLGSARRYSILQRIFARCVWEGECLVWQGPTSGEGRGGGYGRVSFEGATSAVHLLVYTVIHGPIPRCKQVDHTCNRRLCCNPRHLQIVTHKTNQRLRDKRRAQSRTNDGNHL